MGHRMAELEEGSLVCQRVAGVDLRSSRKTRDQKQILAVDTFDVRMLTRRR